MSLETNITKIAKKNKRWVIYNGEINASKITSDWYSWIHHISDQNPTTRKPEKYSWQKPHIDNKTGSKEAYRPNKISKKAKTFKKYENWKTLNFFNYPLYFLFNRSCLVSRKINLRDLQPSFEEELETPDIDKSIKKVLQ